MVKEKKVKTQFPGLDVDFAKIKKSNADAPKLISKVLYYAHYEFSNKMLHEESMTWLKKNAEQHMDILKRVPEARFQTFGKYAFMLNRECELPDSMVSSFKDGIEKLIELGKKQIEFEKQEESNPFSEKKKEAKTFNIQDRMKEQAASVAAEFDAYLDECFKNPKKIDLKEFDPTAKMTIANLKAGHARYVESFYKDTRKELLEVLEGKDEQLKEAYSDYKKAEIKSIIEVLDKIFKATQMIKDVSSAQRKPRKKKAVSAEKMVKKLKYRATDEVLGLVSINPLEILGCKELWVYNTKNRKIGKYVSYDEGGLGVKGTTILNFADQSVEKTLRKPVEQLKKFKDSGKVLLRTYLEDINAVETKLNGKINQHHILLRVVK